MYSASYIILFDSFYFKKDLLHGKACVKVLNTWSHEMVNVLNRMHTSPDCDKFLIQCKQGIMGTKEYILSRGLLANITPVKTIDIRPIIP